MKVLDVYTKTGCLYVTQVDVCTVISSGATLGHLSYSLRVFN